MQKDKDKGTVLIVEDDQKLAALTHKALYDEGCVTMVAHTLEKAREYLKMADPDLMILDIMLPDGNGLDFFVNEIKGKKNCSHVIFLTAKGEDDDVIAGLGAGGIDYIRKPCNIIEVRQRVMNHLRLACELRKRKVPVSHPTKLTKREFVTASLAAEGLSNKEISEEIYLSESRVKSALREAYRKLNLTGVKNKRQKLADILRAKP